MKWDSTSLLGLALLVFGVLSLLANVGAVDLDWYDLWPLAILGVGIAFELGFFMNRAANVGLLIPGGILTTVGAVFLICAVFGWDHMEKLWPFFVLAPAAGFIQLYLFGGRNRALLIPTFILSAVGFVFLVVNFTSTEVLSTLIPILMIAFGGFLLLNSPTRKSGR
ncbi:MAG: hypothetical protein GXX08_05045 [Firmicutes bacterium]|jgi:hypothetical protein|nr:hypothetical protein [Bacillota bacterium]